jgi:hypothetical protein
MHQRGLFPDRKSKSSERENLAQHVRRVLRYKSQLLKTLVKKFVELSPQTIF